jgi:hypothetical protein
MFSTVNEINGQPMTALTPAPFFPYMEEIPYTNTLEELIHILPEPYQLKIAQASFSPSIWKEIAHLALEDDDQHTLILLARTNQDVLPCSIWFDLDYIKERKKYYLEKDVCEGISRFRWCMSEPNIRCQFSTKERGQFVYAGLVLDDNIIVERAIGQGDWERNIPLPALFMHLERQDYDDISWLNAQFIDWYHHHLLVQRSLEDQYFMLIAFYGLTAHTMKKQAMKKAISDIYETDESQSYDTLLGAMNQIKRYMKWEQMPIICRQSIAWNMGVNEETLAQSFFRQGVKKKIENTIKEITSFINYLKLDEKIPVLSTQEDDKNSLGRLKI